MQSVKALFQRKVLQDGKTVVEARSVAIASVNNESTISQTVTVQLSSNSSSSSSSSSSRTSVH
ncbi:MAG TPA: hypothetical protein V6D33_16175 [Cyanophyceae cyanobacterium]